MLFFKLVSSKNLTDLCLDHFGTTQSARPDRDAHGHTDMRTSGQTDRAARTTQPARPDRDAHEHTDIRTDRSSCPDHPASHTRTVYIVYML